MCRQLDSPAMSLRGASGSPYRLCRLLEPLRQTLPGGGTFSGRQGTSALGQSECFQVLGIGFLRRIHRHKPLAQVRVLA